MNTVATANLVGITGIARRLVMDGALEEGAAREAMAAASAASPTPMIAMATSTSARVMPCWFVTRRRMAVSPQGPTLTRPEADRVTESVLPLALFRTV